MNHTELTGNAVRLEDAQVSRVATFAGKVPTSGSTVTRLVLLFSYEADQWFSTRTVRKMQGDVYNPAEFG